MSSIWNFSKADLVVYTTIKKTPRKKKDTIAKYSLGSFPLNFVSLELG